MGNLSLPDQTLREAVAAYLRNGKAQAPAARELGISRTTLQRRLDLARLRGLVDDTGSLVPAGVSEGADVPTFPDDDVDAPTILAAMANRFEKRIAHDSALRWFPVALRTNDPIALCFVGDPHLGSNGCNVPLLRRHVEILSTTPGFYAVNIGDTVDNWGGRLTRLYAENDVSRKTERRLARWFLREAGIPWVLWLLGNHDDMDGAFAAYLKTIGASQLPMIDWRAQFRVVFPNGFEFKVDAAHNHSGHSMWNPLHGQKRASVMDEPADLYVAGHHHNWATESHETADGRVVHLARARGYKWLDTYSRRLGFASHQYGATIAVVIDPTETSPIRRARVIPDLDEAAAYLTFLRSKRAA